MNEYLEVKKTRERRCSKTFQEKSRNNQKYLDEFLSHILFAKESFKIPSKCPTHSRQKPLMSYQIRCQKHFDFELDL